MEFSPLSEPKIPKVEPKAVKKAKKTERIATTFNMPEITLSLPLALVVMATLVIGVGATIFLIRRGNKNPEIAMNPTEALLPTGTPTASAPPTAALTNTPIPTATLQPPYNYTVHSGDTCGALAIQFSVSVQSILDLNGLSGDCSLSVGQPLLIPLPTATLPPSPTNSPSPAEATRNACEQAPYIVKDNDTLSSIAAVSAVSMEAIMEFNGMTSDFVYKGQLLVIPLCMRGPLPGEPTFTPTSPPPYPAPNLLLPADGSTFTAADTVITLQWSSVGELRAGEAYQVVIEDVTDNQTRRLAVYVYETQYTIPDTFRPTDNNVHILRWWVMPVRQTGTDSQGQPIWASSGPSSAKSVFSWMGKKP